MAQLSLDPAGDSHIPSLRCSKCGLTKPITDFSPVSRNVYRYQRKEWCKPCTAAHAREYRKDPDIRKKMIASVRRSHLKKFGHTEESYAAMVAAQDERCAICGQKETVIHHKTGKPWGLSIDHSHTTGVTRALLCCHCNHGLGKFQDDPVLLRKAADYLDSYT